MSADAPAHAIADAVQMALALGLAVLTVIATLRWEPLDIPPGPRRRRLKPAILSVCALWLGGSSLIALADLLPPVTSTFLIVEVVGVAAFVGGTSLFGALLISVNRRNRPANST